MTKITDYFPSLGISLEFEISFLEDIMIGLEKDTKPEFESPFIFNKDFNFLDVKKCSNFDNYTIFGVLQVLKQINFKEKERHLFLIDDDEEEKLFYFYKISNIEYAIDIYKEDDNPHFSKDTYVYIKNSKIK